MTDRSRGLGPLGTRLLVAFVVVALSSIVVLTAAALIGTSRGVTAGEDAQRQEVAVAVANAAASAYGAAGGWSSADLSTTLLVATSAGAQAVVRDASGAVVASSPAGEGMGGMGGMGAMGRGGITADVVVDGAVVGSVRLGFGASQGPSTVQTVAWTWILIAAVAAIAVAILVAWFVSRRISRPLVRLSQAARAFAAGDRGARATAQDAEAPGELGEIARAFDETADAVVRSEHARRQMSADVAHELRTPLAALQAGLEELRDGLVPADPDHLASLHEQSVRLGRIVGDLAELSSAESAALTLHRVPVDLADVVKDAVDASRPALDAAGVTATTTFAGRPVVEADPDRLHQAVGNLLGNAARYCRPGDRVDVTISSDAGSAVITVADSGPGIAPDDLPRVFERLWRGRSDRSVAGSGIGLAIVRELVTAHGGTVEVTSDGHSGTTFTVRLPLAVRPVAAP